MQKFSREPRRKILLEKNLDGIGKGLEKPDDPELPDIGSVGSDPILDDSALFPLYPGQIQGYHKKPDQCTDNLNQYNNPITHCISRKKGFSSFITSRILSRDENGL